MDILIGIIIGISATCYAFLVVEYFKTEHGVELEIELGDNDVLAVVYEDALSKEQRDRFINGWKDAMSRGDRIFIMSGNPTLYAIRNASK